MIGQYLPNNNETATVAFRQKFCQLNSLLVLVTEHEIWTVSLWLMVVTKDENSQKRSKTVLQYRKTKAVGSGYFYILSIKE
jgi:hypothetical protein